MMKKIAPFIFLIILSCLFIGIGYAQITSIDLAVEGEANIEGQTGIVITSVEYDSCVDANPQSSSILSYYQTLLNSKIELNNNSDSSITYRLVIKNLSSEQQRFSKVSYDDSFYDNSHISFSLDGIDTNTVLNSGDEVEFTITFAYQDLLDSYPNTVLNSMLNFEFQPNFINPFPVVYSYDGPCTFDGEGDLITGSDCPQYHEDNCINTEIPLYSEDNYLKDFEITFNVHSYDPDAQTTTNDQPTLVNSKYEKSSLGYPGFVLRATSNRNNFELTSSAVPGGSKATATKNGSTVDSVRIVRNDHKLYYSYNGAPLTLFQDITTFNSPFDIPVTFGCSLKINNDNTTTPFRFYDGTLSNFKIKLGTFMDENNYYIKFDSNGGTCDKTSRFIQSGNSVGELPIPTMDNYLFDGWYTTPVSGGQQITSDTIPTGNTTYYARWISAKELQIVFQLNGECQFYGGLQSITGDACSEYHDQTYINTGIQLFTEENAKKDFEISFDILNANLSYNENGFDNSEITLVNAKYEDINLNYPGFCFRRGDDTHFLLSSRYQNNNYSKKFTYQSFQHFTIKRVNQKLYYNLDGENDVYIQDFRDLNTYFDTPITIGASHTMDNIPFRYYVGSIANLVIKMEVD